jgi:ABC-type branched-subunit amino acid transport system ATPase component
VSCLGVEQLTIAFGGVRALDAVNFAIASGELVGLVGPNGSGKTTLVNILSGYVRPDAGEVRLEGRRIDGLRPAALAHLGVLRTFQLTRVFPRMSVLENLLVAGCALGLARAAAERQALQLLEEISLLHMQNADAGQLSGGQAKLLEFAACFIVPPRITLLDEPFAAIHPTMKEVMARFISRRHAAGQTFLLISHDIPVVIELCPRTICLNAGTVIADAETRQVLTNPHVIEAYLGEAAA